MSCLLYTSGVVPVYGQALTGTTGLLHAPSAEMQRDKTFMFGGNILDIIPLHYYDFEDVYKRQVFTYYYRVLRDSIPGILRYRFRRLLGWKKKINIF